jgi:N-acetylneuraminate synthase
LQPYLIANLVGKTAKRDFGEGDLFFKTDLEDAVALSQKKFNFPLRYGIPVRFHDINALIEGRNLDLVEIHLSYRDLDLALDQFLNHKGYDLDLVVHCPELFEGDHILDLCSDDEMYREKSIEFLIKTVHITEKISQYFKRSKSVKLVVNVGGHSDHKLDDPGIIQKKYKMVAESLNLIKSDLVEIIPQTMPPFPWHFGGQRFHNLFIDPAEIDQFCKLYNYRICFDISHSALACNHMGTSLAGFINKVGLHITHMHIADASGVDGEGLQIGDGDIDFPGALQNVLSKARDSTFIPEIWQGHKNNGADFWLALAKLENSFNQIVENSND